MKTKLTFKEFKKSKIGKRLEKLLILNCLITCQVASVYLSVTIIDAVFPEYFRLLFNPEVKNEGSSFYILTISLIFVYCLYKGFEYMSSNLSKYLQKEIEKKDTAIAMP